MTQAWISNRLIVALMVIFFQYMSELFCTYHRAVQAVATLHSRFTSLKGLAPALITSSTKKECMLIC